MAVETYTATVMGDRVTCLRDPKQYPIHRIAGDWMTDDGYISRRGAIYLRVTPDGRAWTTHLDLVEDVVVDVARWSDGDYIGNFLADMGEIDRAGISPTICGSLADASRPLLQP